MIETICRFMHRHRRLTMPLVEKLLAADFQTIARRPGETYALHEHADEFREDPDAVCAALLRFSRRQRGEFTTTFAAQDVLRLAYDENWRATITIDFITNNDFNLAGLQGKLIENFGVDELETLIDLSTDFLAENVGKPFGYELRTASGPFLAGELAGRALTIRLTDVPIYLKMLFFFLRKSDKSILVRSPLDVLKLLEQGQDTLCYLAEAYDDRDMTLNIAVGNETVFRCGRGVKPTLGTRFGCTAVQLDAMARIFMAAMPGRGR